MGFLDARDSSGIPPLAHTSFSWNPPAAAAAPLSHTSFSWGVVGPGGGGGAGPATGDAGVAGGGAGGKGEAGSEGGGAGVKKGFLHEAKVEAPKDADRFVLEEAQGLLDKVDELHAEDCEETNPFRAKYQVTPKPRGFESVLFAQTPGQALPRRRR